VTATASESPRESVDHEQGSDRCKHSPSRSTGGIPAADRTYLATLIAARTGISQADAQQRVDEVAARARQEAEMARKAAARTSLLSALAMMIGAFVACAAAALGGHERNQHP